MRLLSIVGARPQFVKIAPFVRAVEAWRKEGDITLEHAIVHTGQHYDAAMSDVFFGELELPTAEFNLGIGSGSHGRQTGAMLAKIEAVLEQSRPDVLVVYGDTNSTLAGALAGTKLHIPVAHVEAGLRSFRREMPEEINRVVADHVSDLLLAPTPMAMRNLDAEGLSARSKFSGDIMYDAVLQYSRIASGRGSIGERLGVEPGSFGVVTVHRAENTDDLDRLRLLLEGLNELAAEGLRLIFPVHPRTRERIRSRLTTWIPHSGLELIDPVGYLDVLWLLDHAAVALTDSGGLQKEAFFLGCPCVTLRDETEWVETVSLGGNVLSGIRPERIRASVRESLARGKRGPEEVARGCAATFGDGRSASTILEAIIRLGRDAAIRSKRPAAATVDGNRMVHPHQHESTRQT